MRARTHLAGCWIGALALLAALAPGAAAEGGAKKQEILFDELPGRTVADPPFDVAPRATSGLAVSIQVVSGPAVLDGKQVKLTGLPGLVIIRASQAGNAAWLPARDAERAFSVRPRPSAPTIISAPLAREAAIGEPIILEVQASGEPAPAYQWRKDSVPISGATSRILTIAAAAQSDTGAYDVVASNPSGDAASAPARVTVTKRHQSISFQVSTSAVPAGQPVSLNANASSGLPVRFEVVSGAATLRGATLMSQGGMVIVQAEQSGDATFEAAMPVTQTFLFSVTQGQHQP